MKKSDITASLLIIIVCVLLMIMLWLRSIDGGGTPPSYLFLGERSPITCKIADKGKEDRRYIYSFEADFNDVCLKADAELIPTGFVHINLPGKEFNSRYYWLNDKFPRGPVWVFIHNNHAYIEFPNSNKDAIYPSDGWIVIEVVYWRGWRWPF